MIGMRYLQKKRFIYLVFSVIALIILLQPSKHGRSYNKYIVKNDILNSLHEETSINYSSTVVVNCDYHDVVGDLTLLSATLFDDELYDGNRIYEGGEYAPVECKAKFSVAIIIPYRDRAEQLRIFLVYMHSYLHRQKIHYRIYVIEQVDSLLFNRAKLINIGAVAAMDAGYPCLIFHDIDLFPLRPANIYACTKHPRHMSSSITKFRFLLPYFTLFGGATAILSKQFKQVNGMSNKYFGWGGEDDDLYKRLLSYNLTVCRFEPKVSEYDMFIHKIQKRGTHRFDLLKSATNRITDDGLSSLKYTEVATVLHPLFTHIMVDL